MAEDVLEYMAGRGAERAALASLVWSSGSIPMSDRAKMLVLSDGKIIGTIGGGCLEAEILAAGRQVLESGEPVDTRYTMTEKKAGESGLNCGGTVRVFTELIPDDQTWDLFRRVGTARQKRQLCLFATRLDGAGKAFYGPEGWCGDLGGISPDLLDGHWSENDSGGRGKIVEINGSEVFLEPFPPKTRLYVFGGGHVGGQVGQLAAQVGFEVHIIDDRPAFAAPHRHPHVHGCKVLGMENAFEQLEVDSQTFIVAATRGHQHDEIVVEQAIRTPASYVGMLGSERKKMVLWGRMLERGADPERLKAVYAPVGLNIGADTPEEIAVSVVAELIQIRRGPTKTWKTKEQGALLAAGS